MYTMLNLTSWFIIRFIYFDRFHFVSANNTRHHTMWLWKSNNTVLFFNFIFVDSFFYLCDSFVCFCNSTRLFFNCLFYALQIFSFITFVHWYQHEIISPSHILKNILFEENTNLQKTKDKQFKIEQHNRNQS